VKIDWDRISDAACRRFLAQHLQQRRILADFYRLLPEEDYDCRLVDRPGRRADSPRESLAHILEAQAVYMRGARTGQLTFDPVDGLHPGGTSKQALLAEMERLAWELVERLRDPGFDPLAPVEAPWGHESALSALYLIRDHDILHVGWNLAIMDHLGMERYPSLREYWG